MIRYRDCRFNTFVGVMTMVRREAAKGAEGRTPSVKSEYFSRSRCSHDNGHSGGSLESFPGSCVPSGIANLGKHDR